LAEAARAEEDTPEQESAIVCLDRDHDNMRAALEWACTQGEGLLGLRLAEALWRYWRSYGYSSEGRVWLNQLLALDDHPTEGTAIAARRRGLHAAAWLASDQHDFATAARLFEESLALGRAIGVTEDVTDLLINGAREARFAGQYRRATALLEDALARLRALSDHARTPPAKPELLPHELGLVLRELALLLREQGDFVRATELFEEGLKLHSTGDNRAAVAFSLLGLGDVARDRGDAVGVRRHCEPSLAIVRELGMQWAIGFTLNTLALGARYEGAYGRAHELVNESVAIFRGLRAEASLAEVLLTLGQIEQARGDRAAAYEALTEALRLARSTGPQLFVAVAAERLGCLAAEVGKADLAVRLLGAAARLRTRMGTPTRPADQPDVERALAAARAALGHDAFTAAWAAGEAPLEQVLSTIPSAASFLTV
jgi:tetratricopeptide (TPR) repeat protein